MAAENGRTVWRGLLKFLKQKTKTKKQTQENQDGNLDLTGKTETKQGKEVFLFFLVQDKFFQYPVWT